MLSQDSSKITPKTLIEYYNSTELIPLTITQLMDLFDIYQPSQLDEPQRKRSQRAEDDHINLSLMRLALRTYDLIDFIKKYLRKIEEAVKRVGINFIVKYCLEKFGTCQLKSSKPKNMNPTFEEDMTDIVKISCYNKF